MLSVRTAHMYTHNVNSCDIKNAWHCYGDWPWWLLSFELHWIGCYTSSSLLVFHKPQIYPHQIQLSHVKVMCLIVHTCHHHHKCCFGILIPVLLSILCCDFICALCLQSSVLSKAAIGTNSPGSSTHSFTTGSSVTSAVASHNVNPHILVQHASLYSWVHTEMWCMVCL